MSDVDRLCWLRDFLQLLATSASSLLAQRLCLANLFHLWVFNKKNPACLITTCECHSTLGRSGSVPQKKRWRTNTRQTSRGSIGTLPPAIDLKRLVRIVVRLMLLQVSRRHSVHTTPTSDCDRVATCSRSVALWTRRPRIASLVLILRSCTTTN